MVDIDVPGLQAHQQLLAFRPGDELHVEGVIGDEGEEGGRDLVWIGLDLFLVSRSRHLVEYLLLGEGPAGQVAGQRVGTDNCRPEWWQSLQRDMLVEVSKSRHPQD